MASHTYIQAIGIGFPTVQCYTFGDGSVYEDLIWDAGDPIPSQETLDAWINANPIIDHPKITVLAFRNRFTQQEKIAMELASIDNPAAPMQQRSLAASLRVAQADLNVATYVDTTRPDTIAGIQSLETYGIIGVGRADEILNAPVQAIEIAIGF